MSALPHQPLRMTDEQYLAFENASETKHELIAVVDLSVIECSLALEDVYDKVELE